jgi:hypothetical protein
MQIEPVDLSRYAALVKDGIVECTIALGWDEDTLNGERDPSGGARSRVDALVRALRSRRYVEGHYAAIPHLSRRDRRGDIACSTFLSRPRAFPYRSDDGRERRADVVIQIVANMDGTLGPEAANALIDGLGHSSICVYAGHARHGLGPDFEPAGALEHFRDLSSASNDLQGVLRAASQEAVSRGMALESVLDEWTASGSLAIKRSSGSRVVIDDCGVVRRSTRVRLMRWLSVARGGERSPIAFGPNGLLAHVMGGRHRIWFLLACRSTAWFSTIRNTPGLNSSALSIVGCTGQSGPGDLNRFPWVLDAMSSGESWRYVLSALEGSYCGAARFVVDRAGMDR